MCQNSAIESQKLHAVDAILDELNLKKSAFIAVFYWLVNDPPVMNTLTPYLIRKGTDSASFWREMF